MVRINPSLNSVLQMRCHAHPDFFESMISFGCEHTKVTPMLEVLPL